MTVKHKCDDTIKGWLCADGRKQCSNKTRDKTAYSNIALDSVIIITVIIVDLPGVYLGESMECEDEVLIALQRKLTMLTVVMVPRIYHSYVNFDQNRNKGSHVKLTKAFYGLLQSTHVFNCKLWVNLHSWNIIIYHYDPCVSNCQVKGCQLTVVWHIDNLKTSHQPANVVTLMLQWLQWRYRELQIPYGKKHEYWGIDFGFSKRDS